MITITVSSVMMSVADFAKANSMGIQQVNARLDCGDFPEIEKEAESGKRYVNMIMLAEWAAEGRIVLSDLSKEQE